MKASHALAAGSTAVLATLWGIISGIIPEVAGLALLAISKLATVISGVTAAGHAHLMKEAQDPRDRLIFGTVTLLAFTVLAIAIAATWQTLGPVLLVVVLLAVGLAIFKITRKEAA
ncbi:MAG: hypothetical protein LC623_02255 [Halobacteriales archaeon]|nr:hypothetical protein [Halobacteriales archaeon]